MKGRHLATGLLAGALTAAAAPALAEGVIEIRLQGQDIDFGRVMSTTLPGEIPPQGARFQIRPNFEQGGPYEYMLDFPEEIRLDGPGSDFASVEVDGPREAQREANPSGGDVHRVELEARVTRVPRIGGLYEGTLPVTITVTVEP